MNDVPHEQKPSIPKILLDTNVIIDYLQQREGFFVPAEKILDLCKSGSVSAYVSSQSITDLFYILRKDYTTSDLRRMLSDICDMFVIIGVSAFEVKRALRNRTFDDFEDCIQAECALTAGIDFILTRNPGDYRASPIPAMSPDEFLYLFLEKRK
jgi:predicted nucleic-acid-binding protein